MCSVLFVKCSNYSKLIFKQLDMFCLCMVFTYSAVLVDYYDHCIWQNYVYRCLHHGFQFIYTRGTKRFSIIAVLNSRLWGGVEAQIAQQFTHLADMWLV